MKGGYSTSIAYQSIRAIYQYIFSIIVLFLTVVLKTCRLVEKINENLFDANY